MEIEVTPEGFLLEVPGGCGPTIEWKANTGEVFLRLPVCDQRGVRVPVKHQTVESAGPLP